MYQAYTNNSNFYPINPQMDNDYADILRDDQLILKEEFHALYNTDQPNASAEEIAFVDKLYARIKECDLQTFPYKF